jgi:Lon protease-like protein
MATEQCDLPLFPLGVVLFPGMALPLHIFEPRYREMIARCLDADRRFGVVLIKEGREVGDPATPFDVGTATEIASVERLPDGRINLVTVGTRRFRCVQHLQVTPYRVARVEWLDDEVGASGDVAALTGEVRTAVEEYLQALYALAEQPRRPIEFPDEPAALSFQVGAMLQISADERQRLLEIDDTESRLRQELVYLRRETRLLRLLLSRRDNGNAGGFSRN